MHFAASTSHVLRSETALPERGYGEGAASRTGSGSCWSSPQNCSGQGHISRTASAPDPAAARRPGRRVVPIRSLYSMTYLFLRRRLVAPGPAAVLPLPLQRRDGAGRDRQARKLEKLIVGRKKPICAPFQAPGLGRDGICRSGGLRQPPGTMDICGIGGRALPKWRRRSRSRPCTPATWRRS